MAQIRSLVRWGFSAEVAVEPQYLGVRHDHELALAKHVETDEEVRGLEVEEVLRIGVAR